MPRSKLRKEGYIDTHVYLAPEEFKALVKVAEDECRSITSQALIYIRRGLAADKRKVNAPESKR